MSALLFLKFKQDGNHKKMVLPLDDDGRIEVSFESYDDVYFKMLITYKHRKTRLQDGNFYHKNDIRAPDFINIVNKYRWIHDNYDQYSRTKRN